MYDLNHDDIRYLNSLSLVEKKFGLIYNISTCTCNASNEFNFRVSMSMFKDKTTGQHQNQTRIGSKNSSDKEKFNGEKIQLVRSDTKEDFGKRHASLRYMHRECPGTGGHYNNHTHHRHTRHSTHSGAHQTRSTLRK